MRSKGEQPLTFHQSLLTFPSRLRQKLLPDFEIGIFREENFRGENFARRQVAGGDALFVFHMLAGIDQDRYWFVFDRVVLRPFGQHDFAGT